MYHFQFKCDSYNIRNSYNIRTAYLLSRYGDLRACLHGGGGPQISEVTCGGSPHLSCKRDQIKMGQTISNRKAKQLCKPRITKGIKISIKLTNKLYASGDTANYKIYRNKICTLRRLSKQQYYSKFLMIT